VAVMAGAVVEQLRREGYIHTAEVAARIGRNKFFVHRQIKLGRFAAKRVGYHWFVSMRSVASDLGPEQCRILNLTAKNAWGIEGPSPRVLDAASGSGK
jgi:hypothetical protein